MSSALFLVQTPLHVQNACEAIPVFGITQSVFFIVHSKNVKFLKSIMSKNEIKHIVIPSYLYKKRALITLIESHGIPYHDMEKRNAFIMKINE